MSFDSPLALIPAVLVLLTLTVSLKMPTPQYHILVADFYHWASAYLQTRRAWRSIIDTIEPAAKRTIFLREYDIGTVMACLEDHNLRQTLDQLLLPTKTDNPMLLPNPPNATFIIAINFLIKAVDNRSTWRLTEHEHIQLKGAYAVSCHFVLSQAPSLTRPTT